MLIRILTLLFLSYCLPVYALNVTIIPSGEGYVATFERNQGQHEYTFQSIEHIETFVKSVDENCGADYELAQELKTQVLND